MRVRPPSAPRISVIVPAYNCASYLRETFDSVRAQTCADWECIIVDDGSTDGGVEIAHEYVERDPRFRLVCQPNAGVGIARNTGYARAHPDADYVIFLDSDDVWEPELLATLADALDASPEAAGAHGLAERMGPNGESLPDQHAAFMRYRFGFNGRRRLLRLDEPTTLDCIAMKWKMFPPCLVMVRRPLIACAGLWAPRSILRGSEDWDMFGRVSLYGPFLFVNRVVAHYRKLSVGLTIENAEGHYMRRQTILRRFVSHPDASPAQARLVRRAARDWGRGIYLDKWGSIWTSFRQGHWRYTLAHARACAFFFRATLASDLDLRLHRLLGRVRRL